MVSRIATCIWPLNVIAISMYPTGNTKRDDKPDDLCHVAYLDTLINSLAA